MKFRYGYKCNICGKIYPVDLNRVPFLCRGCGADLCSENMNGPSVFSYTCGIVVENVRIQGRNLSKVKIYKRSIFSRWEEMRCDYLDEDSRRFIGNLKKKTFLSDPELKSTEE